jgi:periplasmic protein CpxP/Spy
MKKTFFLIPGAIALLLSAMPMLTVHAQDANPVAPKLAQRLANKLNLTADQKAKIKTIRENKRAQIDAVLTADQRAQLESVRAEAKKAGRGLRSLNLNDDQKAKIKTIMQASRQEIESILTPAQLEQMRQNRPQNRRNKPAQ